MNDTLPRNRIPRIAVAAAALLAGAAPAGGLAAQEDTVTIVAGPRYGADGVKAKFLGVDYRELWTTPFRVPVLDLDRYAGGLRVVERGGGRQTSVLHFVDAKGMEYVFRSVDKMPSLATEPALDGTVVADVVQDQVSSLNPAAALVVARLLDAVGILHVDPGLYVMPDDPALGEFREEFAGLLGTIELHVNEAEDGSPGWRGFTRITGTERLLERLEESPEDRADTRAYLTARLFDLVVGDWDRHEDQWRWAGVERGDGRLWLPVPRDRDFAFVDYDGWLLVPGRMFAPNAVRFEADIDVSGLTLNSRDLDRILLTDLDRPTWDSVAAFVRGRLTDVVIDDAVRALPPEYRPLAAPELAATLKVRRDALAGAAGRFYARLSSEVDVRGTDEDDLAVIRRLDGGVLDVMLHERSGEDEAPGEPYFRRRFVPGDTREVRVYLHGGDDRAVVRGEGRGAPRVRILGGGGDDVLADSAAILGGPGAHLHDDRGENRFEAGRATRVDRRSWEDPAEVETLSGESFQDWGVAWGIDPYLDYQGPDGLIVGGGPTYTRFGFRSYPYASRFAARLMVGLGSGRLAADARADFRRTGSRAGYSLYALASRLETIRFFGFGNETVREGGSDRYTVRQDQLLASAALRLPLPGAAALSVGPVAKYTNPDFPDDSPIERDFAYGSEGMGQVGVESRAELDTRDSPGFPTSGVYAVAGGSAYPDAWDVVDGFGEAHAEARAYLSVPGTPVLALRAGGKRVWGTFPFHEAAFLGGSGSLRGFSYQRFAGDGVLFGNAELRVPLAEVEILVRGDVGALALGDVGRVWYSAEDSREWHTAFGGGVWFNARIRDVDRTLTVLYARGERDRVYLKLGIPF